MSGPAGPTAPTGLTVAVDARDPTPPYEQVRRQLAAHVAAGTLPPGTRLPPLRQLARDLGLAVGTVARAYRELEDAGLVEQRRGAGTRVSSGAAATAPAGVVAGLAGDLVRRARALGVDDATVRAVVDQALTTTPHPT